MALRFVVLCSNPRDDAWRERFVRELEVCDWWISAEWAGIEDDDEAARLVEPLADARPLLAEDSVAVEFGVGGMLRVEPIGLPEVTTTCAERGGPDSDCTHGFVLTLSGGTGILAAIVTEAMQAMAIGMAGPEGWVLVPGGAWWDVAEQSWLYPPAT